MADERLSVELRQTLLPCDRLACAKVGAAPCTLAECAERTRTRLVGELRAYLARDDDRLPEVYLADVLTMLEAERERVTTLERRLAEVSVLTLRLGDAFIKLSVLEADNHTRITELTAPPSKREEVN